WATVSSTKETADACYYWQVIPFAPTFIAVSIKTRTSGTNEDWFYNFWKASGFQGGNPQKSGIYDASILSSGNPLSFRFFDNQDPPSKFYGDNSGSIQIEVARETPGIAIQKDTLDFGTVRAGTQKSLLDSIESYGVEGYSVVNVSMLGTSASKFSVTSQRVVPFVLTETTNEFVFTYSPTSAGRDSAEFHIFSSNGFGADREKVIYLYGNGIKTQLTFSPDTLDFGIIRAGKTKTLPELIINGNNVTVSVTGITPETPGSTYSITGSPNWVIPNGNSVSIPVTFAPTVTGTFFEKFDVTTDDGSLFHFYATGICGAPSVDLEKAVLDFGKVILKQSKKLQDNFGNAPLPIGTAPLNVVSTFNSNPAEYTITGNQGVKSYDPGHLETYEVTFSPQVHIPLCGNHDGYFQLNYDDGTSTTITFLGCDHAPLDVNLKIDTNYYVSAGQELDVVQKLIDLEDPLDSAITPVDSLSERITYDASLFDLLSVSKGALINAAEWNLRSVPMAGGIDVTVNSTSAHLGPGGPLLVLRFRAHSDAKLGQFTDLVQSNIKFGNPFEPLATTDPGKITISDICFPVQVTYGNMGTSIEQNNPNPFNPATHIHYAIGRNSDGSPVQVRISLYDALGRFVGVLVDEAKAPGMYDYVFDGSSYSSGAYLYVFQAGGILDRKTMVLAK
ncbi:MAG: choice-of-anchor D domain-containing protein, partial [Bacteroidota bacterium]|nr:choice-of-anchor D domain-containing protein [Bacteroidota bacterium]